MDPGRDLRSYNMRDELPDFMTDNYDHTPGRLAKTTVVAMVGAVGVWSFGGMALSVGVLFFGVREDDLLALWTTAATTAATVVDTLTTTLTF